MSLSEPSRDQSGEALLIGGGQIQRIAGERGETPPCPDARFGRGDIVKVRRNKRVGHWPAELVVLVAIPPGFSPDDARADLVGRPRPLMKRVGSRHITYLLCEADGHTAYLCGERDLLPSGKEPLEIGSVSDAASQKEPAYGSTLHPTSSQTEEG